MKSDDIDNEQLDAFLRGEDALAQQLQALPQEQPSAALDAAILARAQQAVQVEPTPRGAAANDGAQDDWTPDSQRLGQRWRAPAGMAAMILVGVLSHRSWQDSGQLQGIAVPAAAVEVNMVEESKAPAPAAVPPPPPPVQQSRSREVEPDLQRAPPPPPPFLPPVEVDVPAPAAAPAFRAAPRPMRDAAPSLRPHSQPQDEPHDTPHDTPHDKPEAWIGLIEEMLEAGLQGEAVAEWDAFRALHPDYPVQPQLAERINALRKQ